MPRAPISETTCMTLGGLDLVISICASMPAVTAGIASAGPVDSDWGGIIEESDECLTGLNRFDSGG
jgi:hypothetical protein